MGELRTLNETGDTKVIWDPANRDEVDAARCQFNTLKSKGFTAYSVGKDHEKNKAISEFDEKAGKIIMVPKIVGG
jgi:hypothetical protein